MPDRREFIKLFGIGTAAVMLCPDNLLRAKSNKLESSVRPKHYPRIHYGNKHTGCAGWCGDVDCQYRFDPV